MEWLQVLTIAGSTIGACWYFKKDTDEKIRESDQKMDKYLSQHNEEMKDFHGRMCKLEERYLQLMQRMWEEK